LLAVEYTSPLGPTRPPCRRRTGERREPPPRSIEIRVSELAADAAADVAGDAGGIDVTA